MTSPQRIQLRRTKGWRKPAGSVVVARPSKWGNPYRVGRPVFRSDEPELHAHIAVNAPWPSISVTPVDAAAAVGAYERWITAQPDLVAAARAELAGRDLACWCPPVDERGEPVPCHADVLLELANATGPVEARP